MATFSDSEIFIFFFSFLIPKSLRSLETSVSSTVTALGILKESYLGIALADLRLAQAKCSNR